MCKILIFKIIPTTATATMTMMSTSSSFTCGLSPWNHPQMSAAAAVTARRITNCQKLNSMIRYALLGREKNRFIFAWGVNTEHSAQTSRVHASSRRIHMHIVAINFCFTQINLLFNNNHHFSASFIALSDITKARKWPGARALARDSSTASN